MRKYLHVLPKMIVKIGIKGKIRIIRK